MKDYHFKAFKKVYTDIALPESAIDDTWNNLTYLLPEQEHHVPFYQDRKNQAIFASIMAVLVLGFFIESIYPMGLTKVTQEVTKNTSRLLIPETSKITPVKAHILTNLKVLPANTPTPRPTVVPTRQHSHLPENIDKKPQHVLGAHTQKIIESDHKHTSEDLDTKHSGTNFHKEEN